MLTIRNLHTSIGGVPILKGIDLEVRSGEVHAIMGPNGSGKSTLSQVLAGREDYQVDEGSISYRGLDLLELDVEQRACEGLFLAMQYPTALPGVSGTYFLRTALNAQRKHRGESALSARAFLDFIEDKLALVQMKRAMLDRAVNDGFSGGEKKRNEILQMAVLEPKLAILDETDSGLDIDALRIISKGVNHLRSGDRAIVMITHYQRLLDYIVPDYIHVLVEGKIAHSGGKELANQLEEKGYDWLTVSDSSPGQANAAAAL